MKKKNYLKPILTIAAVFFCFAVQAQDEFVSSLEDIRDDWIRPAYPILAAIVFLVGISMNLGHLFGENRDIKKVVVNMLIYLGVAIAVVGIFEAIMAISI